MKPPLTRRELDVMAVVWTLGSATVGDVHAYSTVLTILRTLESKGHVRHRQDGKAYRYYAVTRPEDAGDSALDRLVDKVFGGSRELLISRLVAGEEISPEELKRMRRLLDKRLKEVDE
jgi:predicted transcriptional regulator